MDSYTRWSWLRCCVVWIGSVLLANGVAFGQPPAAVELSKANIAGSMSQTSPPSVSTNGLTSEYSVAMGMRIDAFEWSIAARSIDVLSELTWSDVDSYQVSVENHTRFSNNVYFRAQLGCAWILDGHVRDSDYYENNRTSEWSRSISETTGDTLWDISVGTGYTFSFLNDRFTVSPLLGIAYHRQNLRIKNGKQIISKTNPIDDTRPPEVGPLPSTLNSLYIARWRGPWVGCELNYRPKMKPPIHHATQIRIFLSYNWGDYYGEGNWNLRSDLNHPRSFEHEADGTGITISGQYLIHITGAWRIMISALHENWTTDQGTDRKFLTSGLTLTTQLNKIHWKSTSFMIGAAYRF